MSSKGRVSRVESATEEEEVCVVCFRPVETYSIGECDHPVCFECSTRMRVLCGRNECPICRKNMAKVVFTRNVVSFMSINTRNMLYERRYAIYFESEAVMKAYDLLMEHSCSLCKDIPPFKNFAMLKDHMRKNHELFYCELCVDHLKIFTGERRSYTRSQLAQHRRKGDTDDTSHRGHPLCEFCDARFMDNDELFRHLRRDHFFCHICDADSLNTHYYEDYSALREHFRADHYLCEEGGCQEEQFTSVFRTKLDLQAHMAQNHSSNLSKQAARQARTLDIEFTLNHRQQDSSRHDERGMRGGRGGRDGRGRGGRRDRDRDREYEEQQLPDDMDSRPPVTQHSIDINCVQDFPSLNGTGPGSGGEAGGGGGNRSMASHLAKQNRFTVRASGRGRSVLDEEFPSLGSTSVTVSTAQATAQSPTSPTTSVHLKVNTKKAVRDGQNAGQRSSNVSIQYNRTVPAAANGPQGSGAEGEGGNGAGPRIGVISHSSNITLRSKANNKAKSKGLEEDFPALSVSTKTTNAGMGSSGWGSTAAAPAPSMPASAPVNISKNMKKDFPALGPSAGAPSVAPPSKPGKKLNPKDFPSLAPNPESQTHMKNYHGRSSVTIPVSNAWTHTVDQVPKASDGNEPSSSKSKKKKKGSNKSAADVTSNSSANSNQSSSNSTSNSVSNGPAKPSTKKKPVGLHNIFDDDSDEDAVTMDLSMGKLGDYQSMAPVTSSNLNMITSDMVNERKKSELKIGTLRAPPPKLDNDDAFPTLGGSFSPSPLATSTWSSPAKSTAPPGFSSKPKVPPGFSATDMTFTSSSGEKFAISPTSEAAVSTSAFTAQPTTTYTFQLPPRFELRNKRLIKTIHDECKGDEDKFDCFKMLAGQLRSGDLSGHMYYEQCREVMGKAIFHKILPELLVLLPDIKKQQEVLAAYRKVDGGRGCSTVFAVCVVCQQVLSQDDYSEHMDNHDQNASDFPSLGKPAPHRFQK